MRGKINLNDFSIRLQHNKMLQKVKGSEYFHNALYLLKEEESEWIDGADTESTQFYKTPFSQSSSILLHHTRIECTLREQPTFKAEAIHL